MKSLAAVLALLMHLAYHGSPHASSREEQCTECAGLNSTCHLISGIFTRRGLPYGYNKVATIPRGACSINITEMFATRNYIALKLSSGPYIFNGNWKMVASGSYPGAGSIFQYHSTPQDRFINGKERVFVKGPTNDSIDIMLLKQHTNLGIMYEYIIPMEKNPGSIRIQVAPPGLDRQTDRKMPVPLRAADAGMPASDQAVGPGQPAVSHPEPHEAIGNSNHKQYPYRYMTGDTSQESGGTSGELGGGSSLGGISIRTEVDPPPRATYNQRYYDSTGSDLTYNRATGHRLRHRGRHGRSHSSSNRRISPDHAYQPLSNQQRPYQYNSSPYYYGQQNQPQSSGYPTGSNYQNIPAVNRPLSGSHRGQAVPAYSSSYAQGAPRTYSRTYNPDATYQYQVRGPVNDQIALNFPEPRPRQIVNLESGSDYSWRISGFTECTTTCSGGVQTTIIVCVKGGTQAVVTDENCDNALKPKLQTVSCNSNPCPPMWVEEPWSNCSTPCGRGTQTRAITCRQRVSDVITLPLAETACREQRPITVRTCNENTPCVRWHIGDWGKCSVQCGKGQRVREVVCLNVDNRTVPENRCDMPRPNNSEICDMGSCAQTWFHTRWSEDCSKDCGEGSLSRRAFCSAEPSRCHYLHRPATSKMCRNDLPCGGHWFTGPWGKCSAECGSGVIERDVVCLKDLGRILTLVSNDNCDASERPVAEKPCEGPRCLPEWYMTDWTECSKSCGSGQQSREIKCLDAAQQPSIECREDRKPTIWQACNTNACPQADEQTDPGCVDKFKNCQLVVQARLCDYTYYRSSCCLSCRKP